MKRSLFGAVALAAVALIVVSVAAAAGSGVTSNGFETNTAGWFNNGGTINQRLSPYDNPGDYADNIPAATGTHFAGLERGPCYTDNSAAAQTLWCPGPFTDWGDRFKYQWNGSYQTQVDIYLDTDYAKAHPDVYAGSTQVGDIDNLSVAEVNPPFSPNPPTPIVPPGTPEDPTIPGTRFDYTSAINSSTPNGSGEGVHLRDFGFNVSTGTLDDSCEGFVINATTNVLRSGANPNVAATKQCMDVKGWYTFKHSFSSKNGYLDVLMQIFPKGNPNAVATWDITKGSPNYANGDADGTYGCNRYGWFSNQEIWGLPIDNASITGGCAAPTITAGKVLPTGTTCQAYKGGALPLETVQYTLTKGGNINSVSPGVFFYYGTISGTAGQPFTITQTNSSNDDDLIIPVQHGQVILYDTNCNVVKWSPDTDANGVVTGTLPSTGIFIISVKYNASDLKGESNPGTVTYTIDGTTVALQKK
jgi:hypothetical protein